MTTSTARGADVHGVGGSPPQDIRRCPACGQRFKPPPPENCDLCGYPLTGPPTTGADTTPYARAYSEGRGAWRSMVFWVWTAGGERLRHLMLMRASSASRRFALVGFLWLAAALAVLHGAVFGWRESMPERSARRGPGWVAVASPPQSGPMLASQKLPVVLWWNVRMAGLVFGISFVTALWVSWLLLATLRGIFEGLHDAPHRGEGRMTAAWHYGAAWFPPLVLAGFWMALYPASRASAVGGWGVMVPPEIILVTGGVLGALGVIGLWFYLVRLAAGAPVRCRRRMIVMAAAGAPLLVGAAGLAWHFGLEMLYGVLMDSLGWGF